MSFLSRKNKKHDEKNKKNKRNSHKKEAHHFSMKCAVAHCKLIPKWELKINSANHYFVVFVF